MKKDPYEVLKVEKKASIIEIERAYHKNMLNYGFDPRVVYSIEEREKISNIISEIEEAYKILTKPEGEQKPLPDASEGPTKLRNDFSELREHKPDLCLSKTITDETSEDGNKKQKGGLDLSRKGTYDQYFGFNESPFNLTPDTKYFYLSTKHKEALAHLFFGLQEQKGFVVITGEVGTGKTMLCRSFLGQLEASVKVAYLFNPCLSDLELLQSINAEFGLPSQSSSKKELLGEFNQFLLKARMEEAKVVLVIDEAQDLEAKTLEQLRLLSNLETETEKLLQIVLVGQPELLNTLKTHGLRQLEQRITVRWSLSSLDLTETQSYIRHRLKVARGWGKVDFTSGAMRLLYRSSKGVPRMINVLSDRALLVAYTLGRKSVNRKIVALAISNYNQDAHSLPKPFPRATGMVLTLILALFFTLYMGPWGLAYFKSTDMDRFVSKIKLTLRLEEISDWALEIFSQGEDKNVLETAKPQVIEEKKTTRRPENGLAKDTVGLPEKQSSKPQEAEESREPVLSPSPAPQERPSLGNKLLDALSEQTMERSQLEAFNTLLEIWNAPAISETGRKNFLNGSVLKGDLRLFAVGGNFEKIKTLDYPIALELIFFEGKETRYLPLKHVSGDNLLAGVGKGQEVSFSTIQKYWSGKGLIIWKDFENLSYNIKEKDKGPMVYWLQGGLEKLGFFKAPKSSFYGNLTLKSVMEFQKRYNFEPDGVVGPEMKIMLYKLLGYEIPSLGGKSPTGR